MRLQTNLVRRGSRFYYRGRVPEDLKQHIGKSEILISLKTADRRQADHALAQVKIQLLSKFDNLRGQATTEHQITLGMVSKPTESTPEPSEQSGPTIDRLIQYWASQSEKRPRTLMEIETAKKRLVKITGHNHANLVEKRHAVAFKDHLLSEGLAVPTIQKQINLLKAVYEVGVVNDLVTVNPFKTIKLVKPKAVQKSRAPFSAEDLCRIFSSPVFTDGIRPHGGAGEAAVWLPRIAIWTGMRLEEIGQLLVSDVGVEQDIHFISVAADTNSGKRIKTSSSNRRVPIHPELIRAGFLDYVRQIRDAGQQRLFPRLKAASNRQLTSSWSQWFSRYLRTEVGIKDRRKTFHSFRHGFKDACRLGGIPKDIHDKLTGHASSDVGDGYGGDQYPLLPLNIAMQKIQFSLSN